MKQYIRVDSYKVINASYEHAKRLRQSGLKYKLIKPKYYSRYGYTVRGNRVPRYMEHVGE